MKRPRPTILVLVPTDTERTRIARTLAGRGSTVVPVTTIDSALARLRVDRHARVVVVDWDDTHGLGPAFVRELRALGRPGRTHVLAQVPRTEGAHLEDVFMNGADDYLAAPFDDIELVVRVEAGVRRLEQDTSEALVLALARLADSRDPETGEHLDRVRRYCRILGDRMRADGLGSEPLDEVMVDLIVNTSMLHDIGKVGVPDSILLKPAALSPDEFEVMKTHTLIGAGALEAAIEQCPDAAFLHVARDIALSHHERWDGAGYPRGLVGEEIPIAARIMALADVYDALTSPRVYKHALPHDEARRIVVNGRGTHFDPAVVAAFEAAEDAFRAVAAEQHGPTIRRRAA